MSNNSDPNQGPGWNVHDTPYGKIRSYDGDSSSSYGGGHGNAHDGVGDKTQISIRSTASYNGSAMSMCVNNLKDHEGFKNTLYKDQNGNVTVGIGHLVASADMAASLPFTNTRVVHGHGDDMESERAVSKDNIRSSFNAFKNNNTPVSMHLSNDAVIGQCIQDVQKTETGLRGLYSNYDNFSYSRKTALVDMGFNLGVSRLRTGFPKFNAAVNRGDWESAANESHRELNQRGDQRNRNTAAQLRGK